MPRFTVERLLPGITPEDLKAAGVRTKTCCEGIDLRHARERLARQSYAEALAVLAALWREASTVDPGFPGSWREDLETDLAVARL